MDDPLLSKVCGIDQLNLAWQKVKAGGSAGGIDLVSIADFEKSAGDLLRELSDALATGAYIPEPYKTVFIPKDRHDFRQLGLLSIRDKVVQQAVCLVIQPLLEPGFLNVSYGYRPGKGPLKAVQRVKHLINYEKCIWAGICDIDNYFDNVSHQLLFERLEKKIRSPGITALIRLCITMGSVDGNLKWSDKDRGLPQGGVLSPLLSNFYLHPFDVFVTRKTKGFVRYADDFIILTPSRQEAIALLHAIPAYLENMLQLHLNEKVECISVKAGFEYLGLWFVDKKVTLSKGKKERLSEKIRLSLLKNERHLTEKLNETLDGMAIYYGKLLPREDLEALDQECISHVRTFLADILPLQDKKSLKNLRDVLSGIHFLSNTYRQNQKQTAGDILRDAYPVAAAKHVAGTGTTRESKLVRTRKRQYEKLESGGMDLLVSTPGVFIGKTQRMVTARMQGRVIKQLKLSNLQNITITSRGVSFSSDLIYHCVEKGIGIDFLKFNGEPYAKLFAPEFPDFETGISQLRAYDNGKAQKLAASFVRGKISNQINLIKYYAKYRRGKDPDFTEMLDDSLIKMKAVEQEIRVLVSLPADEYREQLFSIEGRAAGIYWTMVEMMLNDYTDFEGRVRQGATDLVNSMLNYGYAILSGRIWEGIIRAHLNPNISYLHTPQPYRASLVFDLIEEFRQQAVDKPVFSLVTKGERLTMEGKILSVETKTRVAGKVIERLQTHEKFRGTRMRLNEIIKKQAVNLARYLAGEVRSYLPYSAKW